MGCFTRGQQGQLSPSRMLLQLGGWYWIFWEHQWSITHTYTHTHRLFVDRFTDFTSTTICLHAPTYLTNIPLLARGVLTAIICNLVLLLNSTFMSSTNHFTLQPLYPLLVMVVILKRKMAEKVLVITTASCFSFIALPVSVFFSTVLQQHDVAKFWG